MSAFQIFTQPSQQALDTAANVLSGATLTFTLTTTSTPTNAYSDSALTTPVANPLSANSAGVFIPVFLDPAITYRIVLKTSGGAVLQTWDPANENLISYFTQSIIGALLYPRTAAEIAASVTPVNYAYAPSIIDRYGTNTTPGTTDMTSAFQAAFKVGGQIRGINGSTYKITDAAYCTTSGTDADFTGCTINQATAGTPFLYIGRTSSSATFVKTDRFKLRGGVYTGQVTGGGSAAYGITVIGTAADPYVNGDGCDDIEISGIKISGFTGGFVGSGASNLKFHHNTFGTMVYHSGAGAGGYGILCQACFEVDISSNYFKAGTTSRHAVYISADPTRANDNNNVCKGVTLHANRIDWSGTSGATGFEYAIQLRSPERLICTDNEINGGYGGIALECENGDCYNPIFSNNVVRNISGSQNCIQSHRTSGSYRIRDAVVCGNSCYVNSNTLNGIVMQYCDGLTVEGNTISGGTALSCINFSNCTDITVGGNTIRMTGAGAADGISFSNTCDGVVVFKNRFSGAFTKQYRYYANPTNIECGFVRRLNVSWSAGAATINDPDDIVASMASNANGFDITFEAWVTATALGISNIGLLTGANSVGEVYRHGLAGSVLTIGVRDFAGVAMPAASNNYDIAVALYS